MGRPRKAGGGGGGGGGIAPVRPHGSFGSPTPQQVVIKDAGGLYTNFDASDIQVGAAQQQVNVVGERTGYIQVRMGFVRVLFRS